MTESREQELEDLKRAAETAQREQSRYEAQADAADAERGRVLERMQSEFGVSSREEAESLLAKLEAELDTEMAKVRAGLKGSQ